MGWGNKAGKVMGRVARPDTSALPADGICMSALSRTKKEECRHVQALKQQRLSPGGAACAPWKGTTGEHASHGVKRLPASGEVRSGSGKEDMHGHMGQGFQAHSHLSGPCLQPVGITSASCEHELATAKLKLGASWQWHSTVCSCCP